MTILPKITFAPTRVAIAAALSLAVPATLALPAAPVAAQADRLDHMWASPDLAEQARSHRVVEETRRWDSPSDHIPLVTEFDL